MFTALTPLFLSTFALAGDHAQLDSSEDFVQMAIGELVCDPGVLCHEPPSAGPEPLRILVAYTPQGMAEVGNGTPFAVENWGGLRVDETNDVLVNTGLQDLQTELAGVHDLVFPLENYALNLPVTSAKERREGTVQWVRDRLDDPSSALAQARAQAQADVVAVLMSAGTSGALSMCGAAPLGSPSNANPKNGFLLISTAQNCTDKLSFTHELGHVLSASHGDGSVPGEEGWVTQDGLFRTMTGNASACVGSCDRIPVWSNPIQSWRDPVSGVLYRVGNASHDNRANVAEMFPLVSAYE